MCGNAKPEKATSVLKQAFVPGKVIVTEHLRGMVDGQ
jgi:S-adenosylmethionine/arginine decarboxylase-like enzyme